MLQEKSFRTPDPLSAFQGGSGHKTKGLGEPGKIYHVRNVTGRENLITCGRMNALAYALLTEYSFSHENFMADRTGLDSTMLHSQAAMVSVHKPVHSKSR